MDALDLLKTDHDRVRSLFGQFKNENGRQQQILIFENIKNDLEAHMQIEETVFYPVFKNYTDFKQIIEDSYKEHAHVKDLLNQIMSLPNDSDQIVGKVNELMKATNQHIDDEESQLFPMVRKIMKRTERERLGRHLQAAKAEGPSIAA